MKIDSHLYHYWYPRSANHKRICVSKHLMYGLWYGFDITDTRSYGKCRASYRGNILDKQSRRIGYARDYLTICKILKIKNVTKIDYIVECRKRMA